MSKDSARYVGAPEGSPERGPLWTLLRVIRRINEGLVILIFAALCVVLFAQVIARFVFDSPFSWSEEMARYLQVWMVLMGSALCMQRGQHITIDFLTSFFPRPLERAISIAMNLIIVAYMSVIVYFSSELMEASGFQTSPAMQIPMSWVYLSIPLSGTLLLVESLISLLRRFQGREPFEKIVRQEVD